MEQEKKKVVVDAETGEPLVDDTAQETTATAETPQTPPTETTVEETPQAATTTGEETQTPQATVEETPQATEEAPKQEAVQTKKKKVKITDFTARMLANEKYTVEEAISLVRGKLQSYRYLDDGFLKATEGKDAFTFTKKYVPVCRATAVAQYVWKTGAKDAAVDHAETKDVEVMVAAQPQLLNVAELGAVSGTVLEEGKADVDLYPSTKVSFGEGVKALRAKVESLTPHKGAKIELNEEAYELIYVPVLLLVCEYQGKQYKAEVNLVNGACTAADYLVASTAITAADKTVERVNKAKRSIVSCFFYTLSFTVLAFLSWYQNFAAEEVVSNEGTQAILMALILSGLSLFTLVLRCVCNVYKKQKMIDRAVSVGKLPTSKGAAFSSFLAFLAAVASVVLFAVFVLL